MTDLGKKQAIDLQDKVVTLEFETIYHSPMDRALTTATLLNAKKKAPMVQVEDFKEWEIGDWSGMPHSEMKQKVADGSALFSASSPSIILLPSSTA